MSRKQRLDTWKSILGDETDYALPEASDDNWTSVRVPHNWDDYHGYHQVSHGNLHGTAWYRVGFQSDLPAGHRLYAFFEGVGSYARVYCNGVLVAEHAGGRTTFTADLTEALRTGENVLAVRAHHPPKIADLPFVCGGCWGPPNTEGSQPFGIFRPVWLEETGPVRVDPFGVHVLTPDVRADAARFEVHTEITVAGDIPRDGILRTEVVTPEGEVLFVNDAAFRFFGKHTLRQTFPEFAEPMLWEPAHPHLYRVVSSIWVGGIESHREETTFGLRWLEWPEIQNPDADHNVVSPDRRGRLICSGLIPREPGNNGHTVLLDRVDAAPCRLAPMGAVVRLNGSNLPRSASLRVDLAFEKTSPADGVQLLCEIQNEGGTIFFHQHRVSLDPEATTHTWDVPGIHFPRIWKENDPYLHKLAIELRDRQGALIERSETLFGIRETHDPLNLARPRFQAEAEEDPSGSIPPEKKVLRLNGKPLFLRGTCEYETLLGNDHAFSDEQIAAHTAMIRESGFNAFRDAHHPHNLRYYDHWNRAGIVCWTQMGSRIYFDTPEFRENFRTLVREWVRERRNHPCVILWGLQNESVLPEAFARELRDIIRALDPTSPTWRLTTTCNGGKGSDWNVPQEWSGTYGGNYHDYDLERLQLVGEYGAWRAFGVHREIDYRGDENDRSETWACRALETKIRLGEEARDRAIGHFQWAFNTFPNPGRSADNYEGPDNAQIGSVNNKGLITAWGQPSDLFYLYWANYADPLRSPIVYIVSHTWPDRWATPGPKTVRVFSNCEEVELFNGERSLGVRANPGRGHHFIWEAVEPTTDLFRAVARQEGRKVVEDVIVQNFLPADPSTFQRYPTSVPKDPGACLFRISCGDSEPTTDAYGRDWLPDQPWLPDAPWGCESWASQFAGVPDDLASRGFTLTPVSDTSTPNVFRNFRYGRSRLAYHFRVKPGRYLVRLYFAEPWYGVGHTADCSGWRLFDVAVNGVAVENDLDVWEAANGHHRALVREYSVEAAEEILSVTFPYVRSGQALVFGIELFALEAG